jgi:hypothetical protein
LCARGRLALRAHVAGTWTKQRLRDGVGGCFGRVGGVVAGRECFERTRGAQQTVEVASAAAARMPGKRPIEFVRSGMVLYM